VATEALPESASPAIGEERRSLEPVPGFAASIVIPVHDGMNLTRPCLDALRAQDLGESEIIIVDDGSHPAEAAALGGFANEVRIVRKRGRGGFAGACNAGAATATGRHLVFLNNDTLPVTGWLAELERYAEEHPRAGIVGARLLWPDGTVQHAGVVTRPGGGLHHLYSGMPGDHPAVRRSRRLQAVTGAAMLVRREVWEALGGFDTRFVNGFEDIDLCLRAGELGHEVHVCGNAVLMHLESASRGAMPVQDRENYRALVERWGEFEPDEISVYAADGLIAARYVDDVLQIVVDPALGTTVGFDDSAAGRLLNQRSRQIATLRRENLALRAKLSDPWCDPVAHAGGRVRIALEASVIVWLTGHDKLPEILDALENQSANPDGFEVVVVNTGRVLSAEEAEALRRHRRYRMTAIDVEGGRAAAWNRAVAGARGDVVMLLAGDFVPVSEFVAAHLQLHSDDTARELVGIGPARFPEHVRRHRFARWIEDSGHLFGVPFSRLVGELPTSWFYCANASLKRPFLLESGGFDERFPHEAGDDYELGLRLAARGMRSALVPAALTFHDHSLTLSERRGVMRQAGQALAIHDSIYPVPHAWSSGLERATGPSWFAVALAWARRLVMRRDADHAAYYKLTLERERIRAYRRHAVAEHAD
jgi:GT2 family glycosyltransferase